MKAGTFFSQCYTVDHLFIELLDIELSKHINFTVDVTEPYFSLVFVLSGGMEFGSKDKFYDVTKSTCFALYNKGQRKIARLEKGVHRLFTIVLGSERLRRSHDNYPALWDFVRSEDEKGNKFALMPRCLLNGKYLKILRSIYTINESNEDKRNYLVSERCGRLLKLYHDELMEPAKIVQTTPHERVKEITSYINAHLAHVDIGNLDLLAERFNTTRRTLTRMFRAEMNMTPNEFIYKQRMEEGRKLVSETNLPIREVAQKLGFPNQSHFSSAFKRYHKASPIKYRNNN